MVPSDTGCFKPREGGFKPRGTFSVIREIYRVFDADDARFATKVPCNLPSLTLAVGDVSRSAVYKSMAAVE
jgi:hypothetical protein